ncbi:hypothetical protein FNV43_RR19265 [Rhamnella rubrinervis]|uniref:Uncharacterized protein n=1 Tax=Rhamnella rubrinervis TaxID=2594499 RepID=A0A8K0GWC3_9ROSA|nr:hypothetical protein FNV43_RR19265 [Rhamnella rubrinervis]
MVETRSSVTAKKSTGPTTVDSTSSVNEKKLTGSTAIGDVDENNESDEPIMASNESLIMTSMDDLRYQIGGLEDQVIYRRPFWLIVKDSSNRPFRMPVSKPFQPLPMDTCKLFQPLVKDSVNKFFAIDNTGRSWMRELYPNYEALETQFQPPYFSLDINFKSNFNLYTSSISEISKQNVIKILLPVP